MGATLYRTHEERRNQIQGSLLLLSAGRRRAVRVQQPIGHVLQRPAIIRLKVEKHFLESKVGTFQTNKKRRQQVTTMMRALTPSQNNKSNMRDARYEANFPHNIVANDAHVQHKKLWQLGRHSSALIRGAPDIRFGF